MKKYILSGAFLLLIGLIVACKDTSQNFSPGAGDPRIVGTWRLLERRFPKDSLFSVKVDTVTFVRDTLFYVNKRYPVTPPQTITFGTDGKLSANGSEMTYYYPIKYFRLISAAPDSAGAVSLRVNLYITTNRANVPFQQKIEFRNDTLVIKPDCDQGCFLKFLRVS